MEDTQQTVRVRLCQTFGDRVRERVALAALTTFRTGGPADWMLETSDPNDLVAAVRATRALGLPPARAGGGPGPLGFDSETSQKVRPGNNFNFFSSCLHPQSSNKTLYFFPCLTRS